MSFHRAVSEAGNLIKQKEEYDSWALSESIERKEKIKTDIIYIEGDGVWVRKSEQSSIELSHFIVHTVLIVVVERNCKINLKLLTQK